MVVPGRLGGAGADGREVVVPGEVDCEGDDAADSDSEEGEAAFAGAEAVDSCVDYGVGLEEHWREGICQLDVFYVVV